MRVTESNDNEEFPDAFQETLIDFWPIVFVPVDGKKWPKEIFYGENSKRPTEIFQTLSYR